MFKVNDIYPSKDTIESTSLVDLYRLKDSIFRAYVQETRRIRDEYNETMTYVDKKYWSTMDMIFKEIENKKLEIKNSKN